MLGSHAGSYLTLWIVLFGLAYHGSGQTDSACFEETRRNDFKRLGRSCFWVSSETETLRSRSDAQSVCEDFGGSLASVATIEILDFLNTNWDISSGFYYWIGLYRELEYEGSSPAIEILRQSTYWKWLTGTVYDQYDGLGWNEGEPWHVGRFGMLYKSKWTAASSEDYKAPFICETELPGNIQTDDGPTEENSPPSDVSFVTQPDLKSEQKCPGNWVYNNTIHKCYSLLESIPKLKQEEAQTKCRQVGGDLACPSTEQKHQAVIKLIRQANKYYNFVWIGLKKVSQSDGVLSERRSNWVWFDDSPYYDFQVWDENEPGGGEIRARIQNGKWKGFNIGGKYRYFLCQKDVQLGNKPAPLLTTSAPVVKQSNPPPSNNRNRPDSEEGETKDNSVEVDQKDGNRNESGSQRNPNTGLIAATAVSIAIILILLIVIIMLVKRGKILLCHACLVISTTSKEKTDEEAYCEINDNDVKTPRTPSAVYINKPEYMHPPEINKS